MKTPILSLVFYFLMTFTGNAHAEESAMDHIMRAAAFNTGGKFRAAIDEVEPLLQSDTRSANDATTGIAWNIRGLALQSLGDGENARRSYDAAIVILRMRPERRKQYASALDNLGSLEQDSGHFVESRSLRMRAQKIYASLGDRAGVARTFNNLALAAMAQKRPKEAQQRIADAFREESLLPAPDVDDLAAFYGTQALEQERDGKYEPALHAIQRAIEIWTQRYGPEYYLLATGYSLRGRAYDGLRDYHDAIDDMLRSLQLMRSNGESDSRVYFLTEISYAQVLRHAGIKNEAVQTEGGARVALSNLRETCASCLASAESLSSIKITRVTN